jgi:hypothetical protein
MEYKEQAAKAGAWSTGLEGRVGPGSGKVGEKRRMRLGGARRQKRGRAVREARSSKTRGRKRPNTSRKGLKARGKGRLTVEKRKQYLSREGGHGVCERVCVERK